MDSIAELHIGKRQDEKRYRCNYKDQVLHGTSSKCELTSCCSEFNHSEFNHDVDVDQRLVPAKVGEPNGAALRSAGRLRAAECR